MVGLLLIELTMSKLEEFELQTSRLMVLVLLCTQLLRFELLESELPVFFLTVLTNACFVVC